jgi:hypothetical protein
MWTLTTSKDSANFVTKMMVPPFEDECHNMRAVALGTGEVAPRFGPLGKRFKRTKFSLL